MSTYELGVLKNMWLIIYKGEKLTCTQDTAGFVSGGSMLCATWLLPPSGDLQRPPGPSVVTVWQLHTQLWRALLPPFAVTETSPACFINVSPGPRLSNGASRQHRVSTLAQLESDLECRLLIFHGVGPARPYGDSQVASSLIHLGTVALIFRTSLWFIYRAYFFAIIYFLEDCAFYTWLFALIRKQHF